MNKGKCRCPICEEARQEVAREIFAEVEKRCVDSYGNFHIGAYHGSFAELKKKYAGSGDKNGLD